MKSLTIDRIMWIAVCTLLFIGVVNHVAYEKGQYMLYCGMLCVAVACGMLACRPNYRTTCSKAVYAVYDAVRYGIAALLPYVALACAVKYAAWVVLNPMGILILIVGGPIGWALKFASEHGGRNTHHEYNSARAIHCRVTKDSRQ